MALALKNWKKYLLEVLVIAGIIVAMQAWQVRGLPEGPAPALEGTLLDGRPANLAETIAAAGGKPVLLAFWASWCGVCKAEAGSLDALAGDVPMLTVAIDSGDDNEIQRYLSERKHRWPTINDVDGDLATEWKVSGVPTLFLIDGRGQVRFRVIGYTTEWGLRARLWWLQTFS